MTKNKSDTLSHANQPKKCLYFYIESFCFKNEFVLQTKSQLFCAKLSLLWKIQTIIKEDSDVIRWSTYYFFISSIYEKCQINIVYTENIRKTHSGSMYLLLHAFCFKNEFEMKTELKQQIMGRYFILCFHIIPFCTD